MKKYEVVISSSAKRELKKLPKEIIAEITRAIFALADNARPQNCKKLEGYTNAYRIRIGDYRVIYTIDDDVMICKWFEVVKCKYRE